MTQEKDEAQLLLVTSYNRAMFDASAYRLLESFARVEQPGHLLSCYEGEIPLPRSLHLLWENLDEYEPLQTWLKNNRDVMPVHLGGRVEKCNCPGRNELHGRHRKGCSFQYMNRNASRFFRKVASLYLASSSPVYENVRYLLWVDADVVFKKALPLAVIQEKLDGAALFYFRGHRPGVESGVLAFDLERGGRDFLFKMWQQYWRRKYLNYERWDDGFQWGVLLDKGLGPGRDQVHPTRYRNKTNNVMPTCWIHEYLEHRKGEHSSQLGLMT